MIGLAYLVALAVYLLISVAVVRGAISYARANGKNAKRWGWGAAIVMYSIVFWDWLPTVAVHQYYCAKDSGFWVYKTLEQWKAENPGVMETLAYDKGAHLLRDGDDVNYTDTYSLNQRFNSRTRHIRVFPLVPVSRDESEVFDTKTNDVLVRYINFGSYSAGWGGLKFWTSIQSCRDGINNRTALYRFQEAIANINFVDNK
jgi:hypothetical protein